MICEDDVDYVNSWDLQDKIQIHPSHRVGVVKLETLKRLREQLKKEIDENMSTTWDMTNEEIEHIKEIADGVFGVEEK